MRERIKEHDRDIRFARTQTSAVSEYANETGHIPTWSKVKFINRDPHWYTRETNEKRSSPKCGYLCALI